MPAGWGTRRSSACSKRSDRTPSWQSRSIRRRSFAGPTRCSAPPGTGQRGVARRWSTPPTASNLSPETRGGGIRFFDARTGELRNVIDAHEYAVLGLARIPNSSILVSSGDYRTTRFRDLETSRELVRLRGG